MEELFKKVYEHCKNHKKICDYIILFSYIAIERGFQNFQDPLSLSSLWSYPYYLL